MINWDSVQTAGVTALVVTLAVEYFAKPRLEARKERHLDTLRTRRAFVAHLIDLALAAQLVGIELPADAAQDHRDMFQSEVDRHDARIHARVIELHETLGKYARAYPGHMSDDLIKLVMCMYGVVISLRTQRRKAELILGLANQGARVFDPSLLRVRAYMRARTEMFRLIAECEDPGPKVATPAVEGDVGGTAP